MLLKKSKSSVNSFSGVVGGVAGGVIGGIVVLASGASFPQATLGAIATGVGTFVPTFLVKKELENRENTINNLQNTIQLQEYSLNFNKVLKLETEEEFLKDTINELKIQRNKLKNRINNLEKTIKLIEIEKPDLQILAERLTKSSALRTEINELQGQLETIKQQIQKREREKNELGIISAEFTQKQGELTLINKRLETLIQESKELESRKRESEGLKAQIEILQPELNNLKKDIIIKENKLEILQESLGELSEKQGELKVINERLEILRQEAAELELFRNTYDVLTKEYSEIETRKNNFALEIPRLEEEKNRLLQVIQESEGKAIIAENLRVEIEDLSAQVTIFQGQKRSLKREIENLDSERANLVDDVARNQNEITRQERKLRQIQEDIKQEIEFKETKLKEIEEKIRIAKEEIEEIENSAKQALQALQIPIKIKAQKTKNFVFEAEFLTQFNDYLNKKGLVFPERIINAFHTSLKVQDISALVILAGISGTGKSELPQAYSEFIGAPLVMLPVQPRWDSPQDLQGFYNYIEKKYKPTELMHYLYQHHHDKKFNGRMVLVLLDEMNLARVEYYFSDFLSKLETRRNKPTYLDIEVGSIKLSQEERRVKIPEEFLFVGTMNEDETTQSLSDKVLDRANVLTFGQPTELKLRGDKGENPPIPTEYLSWADFKGWINEPIQGHTDIVKDYVDRANTIMEQLGRPFAHRVYQGIAKYVANYPNANHDQSIMNSAIADQFGQKLLPKLRGIMVEDSNVKPHLDNLKSLISELQDEPLNRAFDKACEGQYGQFQWKGMVY